jgi:hypothetical protein
MEWKMNDLISQFTQTIGTYLPNVLGALAVLVVGWEIVRNILAGYYAKEIFATGDKLLVDNMEGTLEAIGTLNAEITIGEDVLVVPNSQLIDKQVRIINKPDIT